MTRRKLIRVLLVNIQGGASICLAVLAIAAALGVGSVRATAYLAWAVLTGGLALAARMLL